MCTILKSVLTHGSAETAWRTVRKQRIERGLSDELILAVDDHFEELWNRVIEHLDDDRRHELRVSDLPKAARPKGTKDVLDYILAQSIAEEITPHLEDGGITTTALRIVDSPKRAIPIINRNLRNYRWMFHCGITDVLENFDHKAVLGILKSKLEGDTSVIPLFERLMVSRVCGTELRPVYMTRQQGICIDSPLAPICRALALSPLANLDKRPNESHIIFRNDIVRFGGMNTAPESIRETRDALATTGLDVDESRHYNGSCNFFGDDAPRSRFHGYMAADDSQRKKGIWLTLEDKVVQDVIHSVNSILASSSIRGAQATAETIGHFLSDWLEFYGFSDDSDQYHKVFHHTQNQLSVLFPNELPPMDLVSIEKLQNWGLNYPQQQ